MRTLATVSAALLAAAAAACSDTPDVNLGGNYKVALSMPPVENRDIDVLFVVDNSGSMLDNQAQLAAKAQAALFDVIAASLSGPPNLHVGVITSDMGAGGFAIGGCEASGDGGTLQATPSPMRPECTAPDGNFLVDIEGAGGARETNYTGTLSEAFSCLVQLDGFGCGFEQHFAAVIEAVRAGKSENAGFLRPEALLVVIFLSDEDDCSAEGALYDPQDATLGPFNSFRCFQHAVVCDGDDATTPGEKTGCRARTEPLGPAVVGLDAVKDALVAAKGGDPSKVIVASIVGDVAPVVVGVDEVMGNPVLENSCVDADGGGAAPAVRLVELLDLFPGRSWVESICAADMAPGLERTARTVGDVAGRSPCLRGGFKDVDLVAAGVQPSCRVFAVEAPFTAAEVKSELRPCAGGATGDGSACFTLVEDAAACGHVAPGVKVDVDARGQDLSARHIVAECLVP